MRSNYHNANQSEDSVTKISRSKSRNQMAIVNKIKEKVIASSRSKAAGTIASILNTSPSTTTRTSPTPNVMPTTCRSQKQTPHSQQKVPSRTLRNDRNDLSKAKRLHEPSLDKSTISLSQTKSAINPTIAKMRKGRRKPSTKHLQI